MAAPRKLTPAKEAKVVDAYVRGDNLGVISEKFSVSPGTIRTIVRRAGVELRPVGRPKSKTA
jgi:DNA-directed RNA polymerase specialized sigma24 family protein